MTTDNMSLYQGISDSYKTMPLSVLHDLLSVLEITIKERHEEWESVGRGGAPQASQQGVNMQVKGTTRVKLTLVKGGLK